MTNNLGIENLGKLYFNSGVQMFKDLEEFKRDPVRVIPYFMKDPVTKKSLVLCDMHKEWLRFIVEPGCKRKLLIAPRRHGKTELGINGYAAMRIGLNPNIRIKILSSSDDLASKRVKAIKEIIEFNPKYHEIYGNLKPAKKTDWGITKFTVNRNIKGVKESTLEACGIESAATGDRADLILLDDVVNVKNAIQFPSKREIIKTIFWGDVTKWVTKDGEILCVCTLWHQDDLNSQIKKMCNSENSRWKMLFYAINENCDPLWAEGFSREDLLHERNESPIEFDRAFRNMPISDTDALFKRHWVCESVINREPKKVMKDYDGNWKIYMGVDLAISKKSTADWTVIFVMAVHTTLDLRLPIEIIRGRLSSPETARAILDANKKHRPDLIYVENNAYQKSLLEWMEELENTDEWKKKEWAIPNVMGFFTGNKKLDPHEGLPSMAAEFANRKWILCNHDNILLDGVNPCSNNSCMCVFIDELSSYPFGNKKDTVMAAYLCREAAKADTGFFVGTTG